jgi:hypothetical protein
MSAKCQKQTLRDVPKLWLVDPIEITNTQVQPACTRSLAIDIVII